MHEYSIVSSLVDRVQQIAGEHPGAIVRRLHLRIGELAGVEVDLLRTAFDTFRARTVCDGAELAIQTVPADWRCPKCQGAIPVGWVLRCPHCQTAARLFAGDDIILDRVEMEVPDV
jgi:hydrogenase nickel incorporation protein HypA/HybF